MSWNWGVSESFISSAGSGVVGGIPKIANLVVSKQVDKASPNLLRACLKVKHIKDVVLTQRRPGAGKVNFLTITLQDVLVSSLSDFAAGARSNADGERCVQLREGDLRVRAEKAEWSARYTRHAEVGCPGPQGILSLGSINRCGSASLPAIS